MIDLEKFERRFDGRDVLERLLAESRAIFEFDDVVEAFEEAHREQVPVRDVIADLWDDEPRFSSPHVAQKLYANLFGLFDLIAQGQWPNMPSLEVKPQKTRAPMPVPLGPNEPDAEFVAQAWRYFDDHPKERERLAHAFENRQNEVITWLDAQEFSDGAFSLVHQLAGDVFALIELGGTKTANLQARDVLNDISSVTLPQVFSEWIESAVSEARHDESMPLSDMEAKRVREASTAIAAALWRASRR